MFMKCFKILFLFLIFTLFHLWGYGQADFIQSLIENEYISEEEASQVNLDQCIPSLYDIYLARQDWERGQTLSAYLVTSQISQKTSQLINLLKEHEIIGEEIYKDLKSRLCQFDKKETRSYIAPICHEIQLWHYLFEWEQRKKISHPQVLQAYVQSLDAQGLLKAEAKQLKTYSSPQVLFSYFKNALFMDTTNYPTSVEDSYRYVFHEIQKLDSNLKIENFKFSIEEIKGDYLTYKMAVVSFDCQGELYKSYNLYSDNYTSSNIYTKVDPRFYEVFNRVLTNQDSDYRISDLGKRRFDKNNIALVRLNRSQFTFLKKPDSTYDFTYFDPDWYKLEIHHDHSLFDLLTRDQITYYFQQLDSINLFSYLNEQEKQNRVDKIKQMDIISPYAILMANEEIWLGFDWEMSSNDTPYEAAFKEFAKISQGEFNPTNIKDDFSFNNKVANISFTFRGKIYETQVEVRGDWYASEFLDLIHRAVEENNLKGHFYDLSDETWGQGSLHMYLSPKQYKYLQENGFFEE